MDMPRRLSTVAHGILMNMTFWLIFITSAATSLPLQTTDEILQSVEGEDRLLRTDLENINTFTHKEWNPDVLENEIPASLEFVNRNRRLYVLLSDQENTDQINRTATAETEDKRLVDTWSLVWYAVSLGGLVAFFLVVSCSECCCSKREARTPNPTPASPVDPTPEVTHWVDETPPPYHLFAPPSYDTLHHGSSHEYKDKCEVYVVPVHDHRVARHSTSKHAC